MHRNVPALLIIGRYAPVCDVSSSSSVDTATEVSGDMGGQTNSSADVRRITTQAFISPRVNLALHKFL